LVNDILCTVLPVACTCVYMLSDIVNFSDVTIESHFGKSYKLLYSGSTISQHCRQTGTLHAHS